MPLYRRLLFATILFSFIPSFQAQTDSTSFKQVCWRLKSIKRPNNDTLIVVPVSIFSNLRFADTLYNGTTGVNSFLGRYTIKKDSIVFVYPRTTLISAPSHYRVEKLLFEELLNGNARFELKNQTLTLISRHHFEFKYVLDNDKRHCISKLR